MGALINSVSYKLRTTPGLEIILKHFLKVVLKLHTSRIFLKQDAETSLVQMLEFDNKNKQLVSNGTHMYVCI